MVGDVHGYEYIQEKTNVFGIEEIINECESKSLEILNDDEIKSIIEYIGL